MACPSCDHTMKAISDLWFWCERCGTIKYKLDVPGAVQYPMLLGRLVEFASTLTDADQRVIDNFERCGLREAVTLPGQ